MHQYIERTNRQVITEELFGDRIITFLYSRGREKAPTLFRLATGARMSSLLGYLNFDLPLARTIIGNRRFLLKNGVRAEECLIPPEGFTTPRAIFERKIRYWKYRPMPEDDDAIVSPADARMLCGSLDEESLLFLKGNFFRYEELLGEKKRIWLGAFREGDCAIFRLTPDKYHYNHLPVSGYIVDFYEISGAYHSCNPGAVVEMVTPYSTNKRVVTIIQTDVPGGSRVGLVAFIEVVAMMIGEVVQCYSDAIGYENPVAMEPGLFVRKGQPKSLFRPGSSTDIVLFQKGRITFAEDLVAQMRRRDVMSRFTMGFGGQLTEVEVQVRSLIGRKNS
ncbi:MAG: phosphatidylserine decarboxylase [Thermodesulfobacteriota bacterium]